MAIPDFTDASIAELVSLGGRVAVVTGGARGTGLGIVHRLAEAGATLVIADGSLQDAETAASDVRARGHQASAMQLDVADEAAVAAVAGRIVEELGSIDVWVNNAGIYPGAPIVDMTADQWDEVLDFNLRGAFLGSREAARRMIAAGRGGVIVNIGSTSSYRVSAGGIAHYVSSKFGLRGLTQALAVELGPHDIRALGVAPTFTVSPGTRARRADLDDDAYRDYLERVGAAKPLGRVGVPDDVGRVVLFCASNLSAFMTGSTIAVDAGDLAR
jgi:NAD(P)-dependent dehydrogenase (short-subunit alcohol dehydrogenase family)